MATFGGQLEVVMILWGPTMTVFDGKFKIVILYLKFTSGTGWIMAGTIGECLIRGHDALPFVSSFSEAIVSFLEGTWCLEKWHVYSNTTPLMLVQHIPSSLGYATFYLA